MEPGSKNTAAEALTQGLPHWTGGCMHDNDCACDPQRIAAAPTQGQRRTAELMGIYPPTYVEPTLSAQTEIRVSVATEAPRLSLGQLRALLSYAAVTRLDDDYSVALEQPGGTHPGRYVLRLISPEELPPEPDVKAIALDSDDLLTRTRNLLRREGIETVGDLVENWTWAMLSELRNWNDHTTVDLHARLDALGVELDPGEPPAEPAETDYSARIGELGFSARTAALLEGLGVTTVRELLRWSPNRLLDTRNFGQKSVDEVIDKLAALGLALSGS